MDTRISPHELNEQVERKIFFAGFWMRLWAYLLDLIVIASVNKIIIYPIFKLLDLPIKQDSMFSPIIILTTVTMYLYFVLMTKFFRQTIGKMVFGLKVIDLQKNGQISWSTVIFREVVGKFISKTIFFIGFLVVAFSAKNQGIHDMFADTSVIFERFSEE